MPQGTAEKKYQRILLKLSGEALTGSEAFGIDPKILDQMALEIGQLVGIGVQVGLVVGGGNSAIEAALMLRGANRVTLSYRGDNFYRAKEENRRLIEEAIEKTTLQKLKPDPASL